MTSRIGNKEQASRSPVKGFTLIEVLLAVSILAIGLVGILRAYATSTSAMEKAQYDLEAVFLLKTAMGQFEEKAIIEGEVKPGAANGEFASIVDVDHDRKRPSRWRWSQEVLRMDLPSKKTSRELAEKEKKSDGERELEFYLNQVKMTVVDPGRTPLREVSLETYAGAVSVKNS